MVVSLSYLGSVALYVFIFIVSACVLRVRVRNRTLQIVLASLLPFLISAFRYNVGWDYGSYVLGYELFDPGISIFEIFSGYQFGDSIGLNLVLLITKSLNSQFLYFGITSALCFVPAFLYLKKEWDTREYFIPLAIFVTGFSLFFTGLSAIKQGIAISFCLYSLTYVFHRKPLKFLLFVAIAFLFHSSALIFLPIYLCWDHKGRLAGWKQFCAIGGAFVFLIFFTDIISTFGGERFEDYATSVVKTNNYMFYLMLFWLVIFLVCRRKLINLDARNELMIVLYAIAVIFMLLGFQNAFVKRIASYFDVVQIVLLPQMVFVFTKRSRGLAVMLFGVYIVLYCILQNSGAAGSMAPIPYAFLFGGLE